MITRIGYIALFAVVAVLGDSAYEVCKKCNKTVMDLDEYQRLLRPRVRVPIAHHPSLVPEDYIEEQEDQQSVNRDNRNSMPEYRSLCETVTKKVQLDDTDYEYQPPHYHEIYCKSYSLLGNIQRPINLSKQKCLEPSFHCIQRSRTLLLMRRRWDEECWEPFSKQIASGCDCMWPVSVLGDITVHY